MREGSFNQYQIGIREFVIKKLMVAHALTLYVQLEYSQMSNKNFTTIISVFGIESGQY